jgi:hypothetical protein
MYSQSGHYGGNNQDISKICTILQSNKFSSKSSADGALEKILSVTGMSKNFALYPCSDIENCAAVTYNGDRYILYDYKFMNIIKNNTNSWSNLSILAHEIGHHVNGHSLDLLLYAAGKKDDQTLEKKRKQELEADEYSGFVMYKLGATLTQAQAAINLLGFDGDDTYNTHPNKEKRLSAIQKGYNKAKNNNSKKDEIINEKIYTIDELVMNWPPIKINTTQDIKDPFKNPFLNKNNPYKVKLKDNGDLFTGKVEGNFDLDKRLFKDTTFKSEEYINGERYSYVHYYENGNKKELRNVDNYGNGFQEKYWDNGNILYKVPIKNNLKNGIAIEYKKNQREVKGKTLYENGCIKISEYYSKSSIYRKYYRTCKNNQPYISEEYFNKKLFSKEILDYEWLQKKAIKIEESKWENYEGEMKYITNKYDSLGNLVSKRVADESFRFKELRE